MKLTAKQGESIVRFARGVIETGEVEVPQELREVFRKKRGVFVTLHTKDGNLRGCIGYPEPVMPLGDAVVDSAKSAAFRDPRFSPVEKGEMKNIVVEVSVLTKPEIVRVENPRDYLNEIKIGRDGLIAERGPFRGLLLPQVPVGWGWGVEEFLCQTCRKAGLSQSAWLDVGTKIYRFSAQIFSEETLRERIVGTS